MQAKFKNVQVMMSNKKGYIFFFLFFLIISAIIYWTTCNSLYFDFDHGSWEGYYHSQVWKRRQYPLMYYPEINVIMSYFVLMHNYFGANPFFYHVAGMIMHVLAAIGVYMMAFFSTSNRLAGLVAGIFFASLGAGIDTHVKITYHPQLFLPVFLLGIQIYLFLESRKNRNNSIFVLSLFLYMFIIYMSPTKYCIIFIIIILDVIWFFKNINVKNLFFFLYRVGGVLLSTYLVFCHSGLNSGGYQNIVLARATQILAGEWDILLWPLMDIGNLFNWKIFRLYNDFAKINMAVVFLLFTALNYYLKRISEAKIWYFIISSACGFVFLAFSIYISINNSTLFPYFSLGELSSFNTNLVSMFRGGIFVILIITFAFYFKNTFFCDSALFSLCMILMPIILIKSYYFRGAMGPSSQYLVPSYAGFCIIISLLSVAILQKISFYVQCQERIWYKMYFIIRNSLASIICIIILLAALIQNSVWNRNWLEQRLPGGSLKSSKMLASFHREIVKIIVAHITKEYSIILIQGQNPLEKEFAREVADATYYKFPVYSNNAQYNSELRRNPWPVTDYQGLINLTKDYYSDPVKFQYKDFDFDLNNILSFEIKLEIDENRFWLYETTLQTRESLKRDLPEIFRSDT